MKINSARILITGGSLGIGKATAKLLAENGAVVGITGRDRGRVASAAEATGTFAITADVTSANDVKRTYAEFLEHAGGLDCLINNAGIGLSRPLIDTAEEDFESVWRVNVLGAALMAQHAARLFIQQNYGNIINIASTAALKGFEGGSSYVASKFALRGMSECWRAELRRFNVRVMTINPSEVTTAIGNPERHERPEQPNRLRSVEIAHTIKAALEIDDRGFIPELTVHATNPW